MQVQLPKYIDHFPGYNAEGYTVTNEEPALFRKMLGKRRVQKAACIASGGEVLLTVFLRHAKQIAAIDHSYRSLAVSYSKLLLLREQGSKLAELFRDAKYTELTELGVKAWDRTPVPAEKLRPYRATSIYERYQLECMRRELNEAGLPKIPYKSREVTFIHCDIMDVKAVFGTVDMLYTSNAYEHGNRNAAKTTFEHYAEQLNPGGFLLYTYTNYNNDPLPTNVFKPIEKIRGYRTSWYHCLAQRVA